jgi:hypothetical protein
MTFVDVFISHKQQDRSRCEVLKKRIESWGFSCYADFADPANATGDDPQRLANHIRDNLRNSRCLVYAYSSVSVQSKWMPWELGFYDGRWGQYQIALFDLDQIGSPARRAVVSEGPANALTIQEYLAMYRDLSESELREFLSDRTSARALTDRADVDLDRITSFMSGAMRNPVGFYLGLMHYGATRQMQLIGEDNRFMGAWVEMLGIAREWADQLAMPKKIDQTIFDKILFSERDSANRATNMTYR